MSDKLTFLCMASYFKGVDFMKAVKAMGHYVLLLVPEKHKDDPWPRDSLPECPVPPSHEPCICSGGVSPPSPSVHSPNTRIPFVYPTHGPSARS